MGKHGSCARVKRDLYPTPAWPITDGLALHVDLHGLRVWECACGNGRMVEALKTVGCAEVFSSDIVHGFERQSAVLDFFSWRIPSLPWFDAVITNPPFGQRGKLAEAFIATGTQMIAGSYTNMMA